MKKLFLALILSFFMISNVKAECSDEEIIRLSKIANNVTTSYEYDENTKKFKIIFTNVTKELFVTNSANNRNYNEDIELTISNLKSGDYKFNISASDKNCYNDTFVTKYIKLPYYNKYYESEECKGITNYSYCSKWVQEEISYDIFVKKINEYKESLIPEEKKEEVKETTLDKVREVIKDIYVNYYYIILPLIITILCVIIYFKDKKDQII